MQLGRNGSQGWAGEELSRRHCSEPEVTACAGRRKLCERRRASWGLQSPPNQGVSQGVVTVCSTDGEQQTDRRGLGLGGAQFPTHCRTLSCHQPQLAEVLPPVPETPRVQKTCIISTFLIRVTTGGWGPDGLYLCAPVCTCHRPGNFINSGYNECASSETKEQ